MAGTSYGVNHPLAVKLWSRALFTEALKSCELANFMGTDDKSVIQVRNETSKGPGDRITVGLRMQLSGSGVQGDGVLEGNEEALTTYSDNILINQLRHAVKSDGRMSQQRVPFSVREHARDGLVDWWADRIDTCLVNQLTGNSAVTDTRFTGNNSAVAPDANHIIYANGQTTEAGVCSTSASSVFSLKYLDYCVERAKTLTPAIRPIRVNGKDMYVAFLHPYQVTDLRTNTNSGQWLDIQKAAMTGGQTTDNPIFTGALGVYNNVVLHVSSRLPRTTINADATATNFAGNYRAVFCGAQSAGFAYGQDNSSNKMTWVEEMFDYENALGVSAGMIFGTKKYVYNSADFATIIINTYALAH